MRTLPALRLPSNLQGQGLPGPSPVRSSYPSYPASPLQLSTVGIFKLWSAHSEDAQHPPLPAKQLSCGLLVPVLAKSLFRSGFLSVMDAFTLSLVDFN